jgi:uncharacterized protein YvpB
MPEPKNTAERNTDIQKAKEKVILDVPITSQLPELKNGCEVTSLTMLLQYAGVNIGKMTLANQLKKDAHPIIENRSGDIKRWGNPNEGFVGDITGKQKGYAVHVKPLQALMEQYLPGRSLNLTEKPFAMLQEQIVKGKPAVVWTTAHFSPPKRWEFWKHGEEQIKGTMELHAVVLVGYDADHVYLNDPLSGKKAKMVNKASFIASWTALGKQALSYR